MPNVIALFDDAERLETAQDALADIHAEDDVIKVFRGHQPASAISDKPSEDQGDARVVSQQGEVAATGSPSGSAQDLGLEPFGEVGAYFWRAHQDGAHLMVLEVENPERAQQVLEEAGAERVHAL